MKIAYKLFALLGLLLLAITYFIYWRAQVPSDFALEMGGLGRDRINTFSEKYHRAGIRYSGKARVVNGKLIEAIGFADTTISFDFTHDEQREIYLLLQQMNYTDYPTDIATDCKFQFAPSSKVNLTIRANNRLKRISYETGCRDDTKQRREFRRLIELIYDIAHQHTEVRQLPETMLLDL